LKSVKSIESDNYARIKDLKYMLVFIIHFIAVNTVGQIFVG